MLETCRHKDDVLRLDVTVDDLPLLAPPPTES